MKAAVYARKSTVDEGESVARQVEHGREYAECKGWSVNPEHIYTDDGISGAEFETRPGLVRLMAALKPRPPFDALIISEPSRLGRESLETGFLMKQLDQAGVKVYSYLENRQCSVDTPMDKVMMSLTSLADEWENSCGGH